MTLPLFYLKSITNSLDLVKSMEKLQIQALRKTHCLVKQKYLDNHQTKWGKISTVQCRYTSSVANNMQHRGPRECSPFVRFQSTALSVAFSRGSPTRSSSSWTSAWHVASARTVSSGASLTAQIPSLPLKCHQRPIITPVGRHWMVKTRQPQYTVIVNPLWYELCTIKGPSPIFFICLVLE